MQEKRVTSIKEKKKERLMQKKGRWHTNPTCPSKKERKRKKRKRDKGERKRSHLRKGVKVAAPYWNVQSG